MVNATTMALSGVLRGTIGYLEALLGGIFGLYVILVIMRLYESKRLVTILKDIRHDIREMCKEKGMKIKERPTIIRKIKNKNINKFKK